MASRRTEPIGILPRAAALRAGFQTHLTKPVDVGAMLSAVAALVGR